MTTILCYGDSNTWGLNPLGGQRFSDTERWPRVMEAALAGRARIVEEGLSGRTTVWDDPIEEHRCGKAYLPACLMTHNPLDLVVLMLGTNDLKRRFDVSPEDIGRGVELLLDLIARYGVTAAGTPPPVLVVAPAALGPLTPELAEMFRGGTEKSQALARIYRAIAERRGHGFLDATPLCPLNHGDGLHLSAENCRALGEAAARAAQPLL